MSLLAGGLTALGVGAGDRVALLLSNRAEFVLLLLAIARLGAITVPLNIREQTVLGERVHAFVHAARVVRERRRAGAFCAAHLADYKVPETFKLQHEPLPRNANGKALKRVLRERLRDARR